MQQRGEEAFHAGQGDPQRTAFPLRQFFDDVPEVDADVDDEVIDGRELVVQQLRDHVEEHERQERVGREGDDERRQNGDHAHGEVMEHFRVAGGVVEENRDVVLVPFSEVRIVHDETREVGHDRLHVGDGFVLHLAVAARQQQSVQQKRHASPLRLLAVARRHRVRLFSSQAHLQRVAQRGVDIHGRAAAARDETLLQHVDGAQLVLDADASDLLEVGGQCTSPL